MTDSNIELAIRVVRSIRPDHPIEQLEMAHKIVIALLTSCFLAEIDFHTACTYIAQLFGVGAIHGDVGLMRVSLIAHEISKSAAWYDLPHHPETNLMREAMRFPEVTRMGSLNRLDAVLDSEDTLAFVAMFSHKQVFDDLNRRRRTKGITAEYDQDVAYADHDVQNTIRHLTARLDEHSPITDYYSRLAHLSVLAAIRNGLVSEISVLLRWANPNLRTLRRWSALMLAAYHGETVIVRLLLDHGADANQAGIHGLTPLMVAAIFGHEAVFEELRRNGARLGDADRSGFTAHDYLARSLEIGMVL